MKFSLGNETKFIPGVKGEDGGFTPGQVVNTPHGDEFVCGQLVETAHGPKFVPGQIITLKNGEIKFVPGVTDKNGRFVPGQIIETRGQLMKLIAMNLIKICEFFLFTQQLVQRLFRDKFVTQVLKDYIGGFSGDVCSFGQLC